MNEKWRKKKEFRIKINMKLYTMILKLQYLCMIIQLFPFLFQPIIIIKTIDDTCIYDSTKKDKYNSMSEWNQST